MDTNIYKIPSVLMRGGTSRGLIIKDIDLPQNPITRNKVITKIYGSSKNGQIDGIGGGTSLTSKLAIVGISEKKDCDIFYTFGQVSIFDEEIDYNVTCGNMASAVGLYAVEEGLVKRTEINTTVRIFNTNTQKIMEVDVPVKNGTVITEGDFSISGVSGTGAKITVSFINSGGAFTGKLFPTGNYFDFLTDSNGKQIKSSILDTGNIVVFIKASDLGLYGYELSSIINSSNISKKIEELRREAGILLGLFNKNENIDPKTHALPKITLISEPQDYISETNTKIKKNEIDILGRYISMGKLHNAFAVSGAISLAAACKIPGTLPHDLYNGNNLNNVIIGHPNGVISTEIEVKNTEGEYRLVKGGTGRTARRIMEGASVIPTSIIKS